MKGALPETGRAKSKGADAKPEAGRDAHFTGTKIIDKVLIYKESICSLKI